MREKGETPTPIPVISLFKDKAGVGAEQSKLQEDIARPNSVDQTFLFRIYISVFLYCRLLLGWYIPLARLLG